MRQILSLLVFMAIPVSSALAELNAHLTPEKYSVVRIHTTHHARESVRSTAFLRTTELKENCTKGVFVDTSNNRETVSALLAAKLSRANIHIGYEPSVTSPWGDTALLNK